MNQKPEFAELAQKLLRRQQLIDSGKSAREISRDIQRGNLLALRKGIYVQPDYWHSLKSYEKYRMQILAYNALGNNPVFSHETAAVIHGLAVPHVPEKLHIYAAHHTNGPTLNVQRHALLRKDTHIEWTSPGLSVVGLRQAIADCAKTLPFKQAVTVADSAIYRGKLYHGELVSLLNATTGPGCRNARRVALHTSKYAESPGESHVRLLLIEMGLRYKEQVKISVNGNRYRVDFMLLDYPVVIEFDGRIKVTDFGPANVVLLEERAREVDIQNSGWTMFRTNWRDSVTHPHIFKTKLSEVILGLQQAHTRWLVSERKISLDVR